MCWESVTKYLLSFHFCPPFATAKAGMRMNGLLVRTIHPFSCCCSCFLINCSFWSSVQYGVGETPAKVQNLSCMSKLCIADRVKWVLFPCLKLVYFSYSFIISLKISLMVTHYHAFGLCRQYAWLYLLEK